MTPSILAFLHRVEIAERVKTTRDRITTPILEEHDDGEVTVHKPWGAEAARLLADLRSPNIIELIARAICDADGIDPNADVNTHATIDAPRAAWTDYTGHAREALCFMPDVSQAVAEEREACAKIVEKGGAKDVCFQGSKYNEVRKYLAAAIRARSNGGEVMERVSVERLIYLFECNLRAAEQREYAVNCGAQELRDIINDLRDYRAALAAERKKVEKLREAMRELADVDSELPFLVRKAISRILAETAP